MIDIANGNEKAKELWSVFSRVIFHVRYLELDRDIQNITEQMNNGDIFCYRVLSKGDMVSFEGFARVSKYLESQKAYHELDKLLLRNLVELNVNMCTLIIDRLLTMLNENDAALINAETVSLGDGNIKYATRFNDQSWRADKLEDSRLDREWLTSMKQLVLLSVSGQNTNRTSDLNRPASKHICWRM
jgi:hypothetical protein